MVFVAAGVVFVVLAVVALRMRPTKAAPVVATRAPAYAEAEPTAALPRSPQFNIAARRASDNP